MINVAFGLNDAYSKFCSVTIASILFHHKLSTQDDKIHFFFLAGQISPPNQEKLLQLRKIQDFDYTFINDIDDSIFKDINISGWGTYSLCYRLLIPEILPDDIKKVIYLDCDVILNIDIKEMWDINIDEFLVGAVPVNVSVKHKEFADTYFNSGSMIFNIPKLQEFNFAQKWRKFAANLPAGTVLNFPDQDVLNAATNQNALYLPQKFNFFDENVGDGKGVIHYAGRKPWGVLCIHPLRKLYFKYVKLSPYKKDFRFIRLRSLLKTLKSNPFFFFSKNHLRILKNLILLKLGLIKGHGSIN